MSIKRATIANGIVNAFKKINPKIPMIVRLAGTNADEAKRISGNSELSIQSATNECECVLKRTTTFQSWLMVCHKKKRE